MHNNRILHMHLYTSFIIMYLYTCVYMPILVVKLRVFCRIWHSNRNFHLISFTLLLHCKTVKYLSSLITLLTNVAFSHVLFFQPDMLLGHVIEMWVDRMDNITQPERRKLSALALLSLLPSDNR